MPRPVSTPKLPRQVTFYISTKRRDALFLVAKWIAKARGQTLTEFVVGAVARQVVRCEQENPDLIYDAATEEAERMLAAGEFE